MALIASRRALLRRTPNIEALRAHLRSMSGIVRLWMLQEATGATTAVDATGGSNGTINGALPGYAGKLGQSYLFDGVDDTVEIAADAMRNRAAVTCVALVKVVPGATTQTIYYEETNGGTGTTARFRLVITSTEVLRVSGSPTAAEILVSLSAPSALSSGEWALVAGEVDFANDTLRVWKNGGLQAVSTAGAWTATATEDLEGDDGPVIGASTNVTAGRQLFWLGSIGFVAVFSRSLTASEHADIAKKAGF